MADSASGHQNEGLATKKEMLAVNKPEDTSKPSRTQMRSCKSAKQDKKRDGNSNNKPVKQRKNVLNREPKIKFGPPKRLRRDRKPESPDFKIEIVPFNEDEDVGSSDGVPLVAIDSIVEQLKPLKFYCHRCERFFTRKCHLVNHLKSHVKCGELPEYEVDNLVSLGSIAKIQLWKYAADISSEGQQDAIVTCFSTLKQGGFFQFTFRRPEAILLD
ncbi:hypothetical protein Ocin01_14282 [Orchesella cincta]|uniref:C2H2-type domain-containing protein n=1 Tax=Orchesella cincta TaxID=48709 RepID=A0A1D2MHM3_ORCCI|nr:hypothetical protein Ocin01_14282 [Orchesella cincta]